MSSPTQRTLARLRKEGLKAQVVERWCAFSRRRIDLFGIIDVLAVGNGKTVAVQCTSRSNMSSRRKKIRESDVIQDLLDAGWVVQLEGWFKQGNRWHSKLEVIE